MGDRLITKRCSRNLSMGDRLITKRCPRNPLMGDRLITKRCPQRATPNLNLFIGNITMTLKYSIQLSSLVPDGQTTPYGRYQVHLQGDETVITVDSTYATIADLLKIGTPVLLVGTDQQPIGTLIPALKGGFPLAQSPTPIPENVSIGLRPSAVLYEAIRQSISFQRVDTVTRTPTITLVSDWYQNERTDGSVSVNC